MEGSMFVVTRNDINAYFVVVDRVCVMAQPPIEDFKGQSGQYAKDKCEASGWEIKTVNI